MLDMLPLLAAALVVIVGIAVFSVVTGKKKNPSEKKTKKLKDRNSILKEANKRLAQNPKDSEALLMLGELYYNEESWDKAMHTYGLLMDLCGVDMSLNEYEISLKYAISSLKTGKYEEAYKGFLIARTKDMESFEVNYHLGILEFKRKSYEKAVPLLKHAASKQPDHLETLKYLGYALYKTGKAKEALPYLRRVFEHQPDDKETIYAMGQCYYELGANDQAIRVFTHLRPDPTYGPQAALLCGMTNLRIRQVDRAIMDFEIGLRHKEIQPEVLLELKYRLSSAYAQKQELGKALTLLMEIYNVQPSYRDVEALILKFRELNSNKNLQTYLIAPPADFITLCRKIVATFIPQAQVKILNIAVQKNEYADILTEVETAKWQDLIMYRFIRTTGVVGELMLRDFHARIKEAKAGRGYCFTAGEFSEEAQKFVEARLIDLVDKSGLNKILMTTN
ncbi:MAG: tetratricopeptide repeat protein [Spirochaetes bacterium]|nr:tetratricopeptide repeat protein [Spirochaetota bacterium]